MEKNVKIYPSRPKFNGLHDEALKLARRQTMAWDMVRLVSERPEASEIKKAELLIDDTDHVVEMRAKVWESLNNRDNRYNANDEQFYDEWLDRLKKQWNEYGLKLTFPGLYPEVEFLEGQPFSHEFLN